jgi:hypothetical protein
MKNLKQMIGHEIVAWVPTLIAGIQVVRLRGVDEGGIWIQSDTVTQAVLNELGHVAAKTPIYFVPFQRIRLLMQADEEISLSESAFGL